ncbi:hypothetical protein [Natrinema sp. 74]|uniref:hypothetical protein n=1 Tax=Natrinema sp. 74 TaxID=3384159 RepID=UPI0038D4049D
MVLERDLEEVAAKQDDLPDVGDVYDEDEEIAIADVFDREFVTERTDFESFDELVAKSPSEAGSGVELETIPHGEWDEFVAEQTDFDTEEAFVLAARDHWVAKQLDLA